MQFRIKQTKDGYFAQVKTGWFSSWKRIGAHTNGFGLYPESQDDYPLPTYNEAFNRCFDYKDSVCKPTPKYEYLSI